MGKLGFSMPAKNSSPMTICAVGGLLIVLCRWFVGPLLALFPLLRLAGARFFEEAKL